MSMLGIDPTDLFERVTFKRIILTAGLLVLIFGFAQVFTIDVAFGFAIDAMVYFDVASAVLLVVVQRHVRHAAQVTVRVVRQTAQKVPIMLLRFWARQRRNFSAMRRNIPKQSDDDPGAWNGGLYAPA
jgi:hypothetical protein